MWPYADTDFISASTPKQAESLPIVQMILDTGISVLWSGPGPGAAPDEVSEPLDITGLEIAPDLRVRLDALSEAFDANVWEMCAYTTAVEWDRHVIDIEATGLSDDLASRGQPVGWRFPPAAADWAPPTADRSTVPPPADVCERFGVSILRELGVRHGTGGNSVVRGWVSPHTDEYVFRLVSALVGSEPTFADRRNSIWVKTQRLELAGACRTLFRMNGPTEHPPAPADRSEVFVTDWVAVRDARRVTEWGVLRESSRTVIEIGKVVLPAPILVPEPPPSKPRVRRRWFGRTG